MTEQTFTHLHAAALLSFAEARNFDDIYQRLWNLYQRDSVNEIQGIEPAELRRILENIPPDDLKDVLSRFLEIGRSNLDAQHVEVITPVPLSRDQNVKLQVNLIRMLRKQVILNTSVDPTLIGGFRLLIGNAVVDHSVKRRLLDLKEAIYKEVYQPHE